MPRRKAEEKGRHSKRDMSAPCRPIEACMNPVKLKEHLHKSRLTSNAAVLLMWILLSARQGRVEASYDDLACGLAWSKRTLQRAITELTQKGYIRVTLATNRRSKTLIEVCVDFEESISGVDKDVHSGKSGVDKGVHGCNTATATVDKDVHSTTVGVDNGVLSTTESVPEFPSEPSSAAKPLEIPAGCLFTGELSAVANQTLEFIGFECDRRHLSIGFVSVLDWLGKRAHPPLPGLLASRIIDRCLFQQRKRRAEKRNPALYFFPPGLQRHRDALRKKERLAGRLGRARAA